MARKATPDDLPRILELGDAFRAMGPYAWAPLDAEAFATFAAGLIESGVIFLSDEGMLGGCLSPLYFNPSVILAAELFWYAPKAGDDLRQAFEAWAKDNGCQAVACSGLANEREAGIRRIYSRAGYRATEVAFIKRF